MRCLVTGVAGFIGSNLAERLVRDGHDVVGVDCFTDYYDRSAKEANLAILNAGPRFRLVIEDLAEANVDKLVGEAEIVFHQAAQPGVRGSWGPRFSTYVRNNIVATQRLLEAAKGTKLSKFVYASSSSVYGETPDLPMRETSLPRPFSPYGVTKLSAEHLAELYRNNFAVPTVSLRYFTVYGPRQRPDMGFHRFIRAALEKKPISVYGDGEQTRDFTFIADAVEANVRAGTGPALGVLNVGGGSRVTLNDVLTTIGELTGGPLTIERAGKQDGDVRHTWADTSAIQKALDFAPSVRLREGLAAQVAWHRERA